MDIAEKSMGMAPCTLIDPGEEVINDRCSLLTGRYGSDYQRALFGRLVPTRVIQSLQMWMSWMHPYFPGAHEHLSIL